MKTKFLDLVQEMIVLLPDVQRQEELFEAHAESLKQLLSESDQEVSAGSSSSGWPGAKPTTTKPATASSASSKLVNCSYCGQYFQNTEINFHNSTHHAKQISMQAQRSTLTSSQIVEDFPSLSASVVAPPVVKPQSFSSAVPVSAVVNKPKQVQPEVVKTEAPKVTAPVEEFPPLSAGPANLENRYSAMPSATIFNMPSSHLSVLNKKKHRLQK